MLDQYNWRSQEDVLNQMPEFLGEVDGRLIRFIHARAENTDTLPLVITHGWPGSIMEFYKAVEPLTHPEKHGGHVDEVFHVICPSMIGYG